MRMLPNLPTLAFAIALLVAAPTGVVAQDHSDSAVVSVEVIEAPPLLSVSATYFPSQVPVTTDGGDSVGTLDVTVTDTRPGSGGWNLTARAGDFTRNGVPAPAMAGVPIHLLLIELIPAPGPASVHEALPQGTLFGPVGAYLIMQAANDAHGETARATWSTRIPMPAGLEPGIYESVVTFDLFGFDS